MIRVSSLSLSLRLVFRFGAHKWVLLHMCVCVHSFLALPLILNLQRQQRPSLSFVKVPRMQKCSFPKPIINCSSIASVSFFARPTPLKEVLALVLSQALERHLSHHPSFWEGRCPWLLRSRCGDGAKWVAIVCVTHARWLVLPPRCTHTHLKLSLCAPSVYTERVWRRRVRELAIVMRRRRHVVVVIVPLRGGGGGDGD